MRPQNQFVLGGVSGTNASQLTASFDTKGFGFARIMAISVGAASTGLSTTNANNILEEGDTTSSYSTITAAGAGTGFTPTSATATTSLARLIYEVDLRGRKRYLKPTFTPAATGHWMLCAELMLPADGLTSAADNGSAFISQV